MVVLNRIYTRTGDDGTTALGSGERRPKYDLRVSAYGTVDETNAAIGVVRLHLKDARELDTMLGLIQNDLFDLGADLAVPQRDGKAERLRMLSSQVERLEHDIDSLNAHLAPLTSSVLPGGTPAVAHLHLARTICRRATRTRSAAPASHSGCRCRAPAARPGSTAPATAPPCPRAGAPRGRRRDRTDRSGSGPASRRSRAHPSDAAAPRRSRHWSRRRFHRPRYADRISAGARRCRAR